MDTEHRHTAAVFGNGPHRVSAPACVLGRLWGQREVESKDGAAAVWGWMGSAGKAGWEPGQWAGEGKGGA